MFGAPVQNIEDLEGDIIIIIILINPFPLGVYNTLGKYCIVEGHIRNVELKIHQLA